MHILELRLDDVKQTYLQAKYKPDRDVYIVDVSPERSLKNGKCPQLLKPFYRLSQSGNLCHAALDRHHREDLFMSPLASEKALSTDRDGRKVISMSASYFDDLLRPGTTKCFQKCTAADRKFETTENYLLFEFIGFKIERLKNGQLALNQNNYLWKLE